MQEVGQIVLSVFAVFGLYALFCRVLAWLLPADSAVTALRLTGGQSEEEVAALLWAARLQAESRADISPSVVVLLSDLSDEGTMRFLASENVEMYLPVGQKGEERGGS